MAINARTASSFYIYDICRRGISLPHTWGMRKYDVVYLDLRDALIDKS